MYDAEMLKWALQTSVTATKPYDILSAAQRLVGLGRVNEADIALRKAATLLGKRGLSETRAIDGLSRVNRRFRRGHIDEQVASLGAFGARLLSSEESVLAATPGARLLLVVLGSMYGNFWVSYLFFTASCRRRTRLFST